MPKYIQPLKTIQVSQTQSRSTAQFSTRFMKIQLVHIDGHLLMCFIFDHISPACLFKHGTTYRPNIPFAQWTKKELAKATKTNEQDEETGDAKLIPFNPKPYL